MSKTANRRQPYIIRCQNSDGKYEYLFQKYKGWRSRVRDFSPDIQQARVFMGKGGASQVLRAIKHPNAEAVKIKFVIDE